MSIDASMPFRGPGRDNTGSPPPAWRTGVPDARPASPADRLPREAADAIARHIDSVVRLEVLLLMHGSPDARFTADEIAASLRIGPPWVWTELEQLHDRGFLQRDAAPPGPPRYRYAPHEARDHEAVRSLAAAYAERRATVTEAIYAPRDPETDPLRSLAEAFRFGPGRELRP